MCIPCVDIVASMMLLLFGLQYFEHTVNVWIVKLHLIPYLYNFNKSPAGKMLTTFFMNSLIIFSFLPPEIYHEVGVQENIKCFTI